MTTTTEASIPAHTPTTETLAVALPMQPGAADPFRELARQAMGPRAEEQDASRRRIGITRERCWIQQTPQGDMFILMLEGQDPARANRVFAESTDPYDVWFKDEAGRALGVDFSQPIPVRGELVYRSITPGAPAKRQEVAFVLPVLPGKLDRARELAAEVNGARRAAHDDFHRRVGVEEDWYLQPTPDGGHVFIALLASDDLGAAIGGLAQSQVPHDRWFKDMLLQVEGVDWSKPPQGPLPQLIFDYPVSR